MRSRVFQVIVCSLALFGARSGRASETYVEEMIACPESEEAMVSGAYDAFLGALERGQIRKDDLRLPSRLTERRNDHVIFSRGFYVSPNELRGFELVIPASLLAEENGVLRPLADLSVASQDVRQRITILVMKKTEANQSVESNAGLPPPSNGKSTGVSRRLPGVSHA